MFFLSKMNCNFEEYGGVGIFSFSGKLTEEHKDDLNMLLMRAIHSIDRVVLNFSKVKQIDVTSLMQIKKAYYTSLRLDNPLIMTAVPAKYRKELFDDKLPNKCKPGNKAIKEDALLTLSSAGRAQWE